MDIRSLVENTADFFRGTYAWILRNAPPLVAKTIPRHIRKINEDEYKSGYQKGYAIGEKAGHKIGFTLGEKAGYEKGSLAGEKSGYRIGFEEGKNIWVITDERAIGSTSIDHSVYGPQKFKVTDEMRCSMRKEVADAVAKKLIPPPTDDQWKMIFADHPATRVAAGAGSGKSTTLLLRVIFMLEHLKIHENEITIVSFTTAACHELRTTLVKVIQHWGYSSFTFENAKRLVRTFHSLLYQMSKQTFGKIDFFENLKEKNGRKPVEAVNSLGDRDVLDDEFGLEDVENPFSSAKLSDLQINVLKESYINLYNSDDQFKRHIDALRRLALLARLKNKDESERDYNYAITRIASGRDIRLVETINARVRDVYGFPNFGFEIGPVYAFEAGGHKFYANGYIPSEKTYVFIGGFAYENALFDAEEIFPDSGSNREMSNYDVIKVKKNIVSRYLGGKHFYINSPENLRNLKDLVAIFDEGNSEEEPLSNTAPMFDIQLEGEISSSAIFEAFHGQANFIESMGLRVSEAIKKMRPYRSVCLEYHFSCALSAFWKRFENDLRARNMFTFNFAFLELASENILANHIHDRTLMPFSHLLIDEFQDISAQIVAWLLKTQQRTVVRKDLAADWEDVAPPVSVMAIGDDWQSIYGWRGSAPFFFTKFDNHFPSHPQLGKASTFEMGENFRSVEPILHDSEILLKSVASRTEKTCTTNKLLVPGDHGIRIEEYKTLDDETKARIVAIIKEQHGYVSSLENPYKNRVIVMSRRNETLDDFKPLLKDLAGTVFYTYHRAKGLQGEVAIMIEDCIYDSTHLLRNRIYECVDWLPKNFTYDQAQSDEAARLAYVGATRGMRRVIWFVEIQKENSKNLGAAGRFQAWKTNNA